MSDFWKGSMFATLTIWSATNLYTALNYSLYDPPSPPAALVMLIALWLIASLIAVPVLYIEAWIREVKKAAEHPLAKDISE